MNIVLVAIGGATGSVLRYLMQNWVGRYSPNFPLGTVLINILGSFLMGLLVSWLAREAPQNAVNLRIFFGIGILGGFTTFSSFSLDAITLMNEQRFGAMAAYVLISVICSLLGLYTGWHLMKAA